MMLTNEQIQKNVEKARGMLANATHVLVGAGAGMGVDSGLPDFRGDTGFWNAYPAFEGKSFSEVASLRSFRENIDLAWGFYGHRADMYRDTEPHEGFGILLEFLKGKDYFVFTSNVDGHFQKAGFDTTRIYECHGTIRRLQCMNQGCGHIWNAGGLKVPYDANTFRAKSIPTCPECGMHARPNILMFGDWEWNGKFVEIQESRYIEFLHRTRGKNTVSIEIGAGKTIPSVRSACHDYPRIRINPRDFECDRFQDVAIPFGALEGLKLILGK